MNWINLEHLLLKGHADRRVSVDPELNHDTLRERALRLVPCHRDLWRSNLEVLG